MLLMKNGKIFCPIGNFSDLQYFPIIHQKRVRRLFIFFWKSLHNFQEKDAFGAVERRFKKKHLGNFPGFCPIGNFSDLQYFQVIHQKRVRRLFIFFLKSLHYFWKKDAFGCPIENFSDLCYFPVIHQKRVRRLFIFFWKSLHYFWKKDAFGCPIGNFSDLFFRFSPKASF